MVQEEYFSASVPLMRCIEGFICQFGLTADKELNAKYRHDRIKDDPNWLPEGKTHRTNKHGVKRFPRGYLAYAGAGPNTRRNQFIVSLQDSPLLAGGSPWEVPWGELVGEHSFETLGRIYTGYGDEGPSQGKLNREGMTEDTRQQFPDLDYITFCEITDEENQY